MVFNKADSKSIMKFISKQFAEERKEFEIMSKSTDSAIKTKQARKREMEKTFEKSRSIIQNK